MMTRLRPWRPVDHSQITIVVPVLQSTGLQNRASDWAECLQHIQQCVSSYHMWLMTTRSMTEQTNPRKSRCQRSRYSTVNPLIANHAAIRMIQFQTLLCPILSSLKIMSVTYVTTTLAILNVLFSDRNYTSLTRSASLVLG